MTKSAPLRLIGALLFGFGLGGCAAVAVEGAQAARSEIVISQNMAAAQAGDPRAQFMVGDAYCCSLNEGSGLYNTRTSVEWLCKSARQNYAPAMFKLGKIYSGDTVDGVRLARRVAAATAGTSTNLPVAAVWLRLAEVNGERDAAARFAELWGDLSAADRATTQRVLQSGLNAPCLWNQVIATR